MFRTNKYQAKIFQVGHPGCYTSCVWEGRMYSSRTSPRFFWTGSWSINVNESYLFQEGRDLHDLKNGKSPQWDNF